MGGNSHPGMVFGAIPIVLSFVKRAAMAHRLSAPCLSCTKVAGGTTSIRNVSAITFMILGSQECVEYKIRTFNHAYHSSKVAWREIHTILT